VLGGVAGILQAPVQPVLAPGFMTLNALIPAFGAALLAGMESLTGAVVAAEAIGLAQGFGTYLLQRRLSVPGAPEIVAFAILLGVLQALPSRLLREA